MSDFRVWHYDGISGVRRTPLLAVEEGGFRLIDGDAASELLPFADLVASHRVGGDTVFGMKHCPGWRIGFSGDAPPDIAARLPTVARYGRVIDRVGLWPAVGVSAVLAAIVIALFLHTPALVARAIPPAVEQRLGDLMVGDFGSRGCAAPGGAEALAALVERVDPMDPFIEVRVVNLPIVNAVTLPGGKIVLFDGLVRAATSPDEVAGVLAHEIGHVQNRDVMESLLRQLGLSVLLGGLQGNIGGYTNALLAATYSRAAEARADAHAIAALGAAHVSPLGTAAFFERLDGRKPGKARAKAEGVTMLNYFSSHPVSSDRAAAFTASARGHTDYTPALDAASWTKLQAICRGDTEKSKTGFRF